MAVDNHFTDLHHRFDIGVVRDVYHDGLCMRPERGAEDARTDLLKDIRAELKCARQGDEQRCVRGLGVLPLEGTAVAATDKGEFQPANR